METVHTFGSHGGLVGILTDPGPDSRGDAPGVVFSNVGLNHRVGPNRLYVELARTLATAGFRSLRFDLSGFGDSEPRRTAGTDLERASLDTHEAMDFLEKKGVRTFVLVGFCSGVDSAHAVALDDDRVVGAVFIDGYAYPNLGYWLRYWTTRNLQPARWRRYFRERLSRFSAKQIRRETGELKEIFASAYPTREAFSADLKRLVARSVRMLFVYTVVADQLYNYAEQFHDMFGYRDRIAVEFYTQADHVFSTEAHRDRLLARLLQWFTLEFPRSPSDRPTPKPAPGHSPTPVVRAQYATLPSER